MTVRIPERARAELENWSAWCWQGSFPHPLPATKCGSLESGYRAPPDWNPDDPPPPPRIRPNERHAKRVQKVYDALEESGRQVLKAEYPCRAERGTRTQAAHRLNLSLAQYESWLQLAVNRVEAEFNAVCN